MSDQYCSEEDAKVQHSASQTYSVAELVPEEHHDLTMEQILALLVSRIVNYPEDVRVHVANEGRIKAVEFEIRTEDQGQLLGRDGYTIHALRTISKAILGALVKQYSYKVGVVPDRDGGRR